MNADEILAQARAGSELPHGWIVFPLLRSKVVWGIAGWALGIVLGAGLFAVIAPVVIPYNYEHGLTAAIFTTLLLGVLLFITVGSATLLIADVRRLREADKHVMVLTQEEFVKQEGKKIIHVPLINVRYVTARGLPPPDRTPPPTNKNHIREIPGIGENVTSFFLGRGVASSKGVQWRRRRMRTPTSLAFVDTRTDEEITVVSDGAYGDPFMIAALLKKYAATTQEIVL